MLRKGKRDDVIVERENFIVKWLVVLDKNPTTLWTQSFMIMVGVISTFAGMGMAWIKKDSVLNDLEVLLMVPLLRLMLLCLKQHCRFSLALNSLSKLLSRWIIFFWPTSNWWSFWMMWAASLWLFWESPLGRRHLGEGAAAVPKKSIYSALFKESLLKWVPREA